MRTTDINMLEDLNIRETESDWCELFDEVKGFRFWGVNRPVKCGVIAIEIVGEEGKH